MCRIDGADRSEVLQSAMRKARKEHRCSECRRTIQPGEQYQYDVTLYEGSMDTNKTCAHCMVARAWLLENCGGYIYGEVIEEVQEHGEEYRQLRIPLYRVAAAARRKWQRFGGGLMPIPAPPPNISVQERH